MEKFNLFDAELLVSQFTTGAITLTKVAQTLVGKQVTEEAEVVLSSMMDNYNKLIPIPATTLVKYLHGVQHAAPLDHMTGKFVRVNHNDELLPYLSSRGDKQALYFSNIQVIATYHVPQTTDYAKSIYKIYLKAYRKLAKAYPNNSYSTITSYLTKASKD